MSLASIEGTSTLDYSWYLSRTNQFNGLHSPQLPLHKPPGAGGYRERDIQRLQEEDLPDTFDAFDDLS